MSSGLQSSSAPRRVDPSDVRVCLASIVQSATLGEHETLRRLVSFMVERALTAPDAPLREYEIGVKIMRLGGDWDPRTDATVRLEVSHLRNRLAEYYHREGVRDPIHMVVPKGAFHVIFVRAENAPASTFREESQATGTPEKKVPTKLILAAVGVLVAVAGVWFGLKFLNKPGGPDEAAEEPSATTRPSSTPHRKAHSEKAPAASPFQQARAAARDFNATIARLKGHADTDPKRVELAKALWWNGGRKSAAKTWEQVQGELSPSILAMWGLASIDSKKIDQARAKLSSAPALEQARFYALMTETGPALDALEKVLAKELTPAVVADPIFTSIEREPRYIAILRSAQLIN
ncbi:MAG: hypothetical protein NTV70_21535 [Acidobacteria bacterium]|nr:hypothetical protein [Acidobacteriota bacterium]